MDTYRTPTDIARDQLFFILAGVEGDILFATIMAAYMAVCRYRNWQIQSHQAVGIALGKLCYRQVRAGRRNTWRIYHIGQTDETIASARSTRSRALAALQSARSANSSN